jgi:hypothetical protein
MNLRRIIDLSFAVLIAVGLSVAPFTGPAAAKQMAMSGMADMPSMSEGMPCCPDTQKSRDCRDCPLVAMCVLKTVQAGPSPTEALPLRHPIRTVHSVLNDAPADGLNRPPPDQPPRNLA